MAEWERSRVAPPRFIDVPINRDPTPHGPAQTGWSAAAAERGRATAADRGQHRGEPC
jgi:hypothetical protein